MGYTLTNMGYIGVVEGLHMGHVMVKGSGVASPLDPMGGSCVCCTKGAGSCREGGCRG